MGGQRLIITSCCFGVQSRKLSNIGQSLDGLLRATPYFRRHIEPLLPAAFAVVSTHQPAMGPRGVLWPVFHNYVVIHKEGLCPNSGDINGLMMIRHFCPRIVHDLIYYNLEISRNHSFFQQYI
jgi:hypothetical protein